MDIHVYNEQQDLLISSQEVINIVKEVLQSEGIQCDEVSIHFVDTPTLCTLHDDYFNDPSPTDCISFPIDPPIKTSQAKDDSTYCVLGEVFVCPQTAIEYAKNEEATPYEEVSLYIIHGLLHLLGYDDQGAKEEAMREAEQRHLSHLKTKKLLLKEGSCPS